MRFALPLALALWAAAAPAQTTPPTQDLARDGLETTITLLSDDPAASLFELGMLQSLRAVEKTLQIRYEYGLGQRLSDLPVLRLELPGGANPAPKPSGPETLSMIIDGFVSDMAEARATLERAEVPGIAPFEMALTDIWFDVNANGKREAAETAIATLGDVILGQRANRELARAGLADQPLIVRFDAADHAWLVAYTHMLSGFGNLFLAFDPTPVFRDLADQRAALADAPQIPDFHDPETIRNEIAALKAQQASIESQRSEIRTRIETLGEETREIRAEIAEAANQALKADLQARVGAKQRENLTLRRQERPLVQASQLIGNEIRAAEAKLPGRPDEIHEMIAENQDLIDTIYIVITALAQQPDPARIHAANDNLKAMIASNRTFWARLAQETDNENEWIPNATQTSVLPLTVPPGVAEAWQNILRDIEAMLEGKLLITHPALPAGYGLSLPAYVADPAPLDIVGWLHGVSAYRYAAKGPRLTSQSMRAFERLTLGNAGGFALLFN